MRHEEVRGEKDTLTEFPHRRNGTQKHFYGQKKNPLDYHLFASRNQQRRKNEGDDNDNLYACSSAATRRIYVYLVRCRAYIIVNYL